MSDEHTTKELPAVDPATEMLAMLRKLDGKVDRLQSDVALLGGNYQDLSNRVTLAERWRQDYDEWRARTSERVRSEEAARSQVDLEHQTHLVHIEDRFAKLTEAQTSTLVAAMERAAGTPQGQKLINAIVGFLVLVLTLAGGWLLTHGGAR